PPIPDTAQVVPDTTYQTGPDIPAERTYSPEVAIREALNAALAGLQTGVSLDDFDSDDFINALRRDTLFEDLDADVFNRGGGDWLRALDSDAEGDEELILQDGNDDESVDDIASVASDESGDDLANEDDDVPVEFDLTSEDLDNLRAGGWDVYMEQQSCQVLHEGSSLYVGPSGPTRAALAYAENPLAIFYFFLPKELWRKIAIKRASFAETARIYRPADASTCPSPSRKLERKSSIQPHEVVRFIGLLVARTLEPRRESLSRHWITKAERALSRGTFGQSMSRDRFHDIARYLHFNDNARLEIYCGKANANEDAVAQRAVVKNVTRVLQGLPSQRLICTDNFYTSFPLSGKLLSMGHYHVGTIRKDRKGWCKAIDFTQKKRPKKMARGTFRIAK
ncbi:hypothetical protein L916_14549, partial [Phytophthora nicotianae]